MRKLWGNGNSTENTAGKEVVSDEFLLQLDLVGNWSINCAVELVHLKQQRKPFVLPYHSITVACLWYVGIIFYMKKLSFGQWRLFRKRVSYKF